MGSAWAADLNPIALLWTLLSLPIYVFWLRRVRLVGPAAEVWSVWQDRQALRRNGMLTTLSQRHFERAIGRLILLILIMLIGLASLFTPFVPPTTPRGWLILVGLLLIPVMIQLDGIRDQQLRERVLHGERRGR